MPAAGCPLGTTAGKSAGRSVRFGYRGSLAAGLRVGGADRPRRSFMLRHVLKPVPQRLEMLPGGVLRGRGIPLLDRLHDGSMIFMRCLRAASNGEVRAAQDSQYVGETAIHEIPVVCATVDCQ